MSENEKLLGGLLLGTCFAMGCFIGSTVYYRAVAKRKDELLDRAVTWIVKLMNEESKEEA